MVERGEKLYARWGWLAVFFTPAIVSGTAKMRPYQFALWNLLDSLG
jgi:membrane protein DedA with SNARE-associated domain